MNSGNELVAPLNNNQLAAREMENKPLLSNKDSDNPFKKKKPKGISFEVLRNTSTLSLKMENSFFEIENKNIFQFLWYSLKEGLPTSFSYGDFFLCSLICRLFLGKTDNLDLVASTGYYGAFYSILM
jgi:hypothetical protein